MGRADDMENEQKAEEKARLAISCVLRAQGNNMKMWLFLCQKKKKKQLKKIERECDKSLLLIVFR